MNQPPAYTWPRSLRRRRAASAAVRAKMARMRAAKERKRLAHVALLPPPAPRLPRRWALELGVRDTASGDVALVPLRSLRDAMRRLSVVLRYYRPLS